MRRVPSFRPGRQGGRLVTAACLCAWMLLGGHFAVAGDMTSLEQVPVGWQPPHARSADTSTYATNAGTANYSTSAGSAGTAGSAGYASNAGNAETVGGKSVSDIIGSAASSGGGSSGGGSSGGSSSFSGCLYQLLFMDPTTDPVPTTRCGSLDNAGVLHNASASNSSSYICTSAGWQQGGGLDCGPTD